MPVKQAEVTSVKDIDKVIRGLILLGLFDGGAGAVHVCNGVIYAGPEGRLVPRDVIARMHEYGWEYDSEEDRWGWTH